MRVSVSVRQASEESVEDREEPFAAGQRGGADGVANLLLMMPLLGVFARDVEPVLRFLLAGPCDAEQSRSEWIERSEKLADLRASDFEKFDQKPRTDSLRRSDPIGVELIQKVDQFAVSIS